MATYWIDQREFPQKPSESWCIVHPNRANCKLSLKIGDSPLCVANFEGFVQGSKYKVLNLDESQGWVSIQLEEDVIKMPMYLFARHFNISPYIKLALATDVILED